MNPPRSRQQTRAAILQHLLTAGDCFRGALVQSLGLTEASISRIVAELRAEALVSEYDRRPAPYQGGPTRVVALNRELRVLGVELSNARVSVGVGNLGGTMDYARRRAIPAAADAATVERAVLQELAAARQWSAQHGVRVRHAAITLPGFGALGQINAIVPTSPQRLEACVAGNFPGTPVTVTNSVQAQAAAHGFGIPGRRVDAEHLFVFVGHGIGAARIGRLAVGAEHRPVELGHMVMDPQGPLCRCGHRGCLEAFAALPAVAAAFGLDEDTLLARSDEGLAALPVDGEAGQRIREMLGRLGLALGNALNVDPVGHVVVAGWPSLLDAAMRSVMLDAIDASVLGGLRGRDIEVAFIPPSIGNDPFPAICFAAYAFVQSGAVA